jgi:hypothetical protein
MSILNGFLSLLSGKEQSENDKAETTEGVVGEPVPELELSIDDEELLSLAKKWETSWTTWYSKMEKAQAENERYWLGNQFTSAQMSSENRPLIDNRIFTALETFLPIATRQNPEPLVNSENTIKGEELCDKVGKMLSYQGDKQRLRLKLKKAMRYWSLYFLGVAKVGWDMVEDDIKTVIVRPHRLILDSNATVDEDGYTGEYVGEYREDHAKILVRRFPKKKDFLEKYVDGKMDTKIKYIEFWTDEYVFWKLDKTILGKAKNPHWNYDETNKRVDEYGNETEENTAGKNHFSVPKKPYVFLSIFNIGLHPLDDTSLISQNLALQDLVNKRLRQIDRNVDGMNGGAVVSGDQFTLEEASQVSEALRKGGTVWVPVGDVNTAYRRDQSVPLPADVYNQLQDARNTIDTVFGTHATSRGEQQQPDTATGKMLSKQGDESRIGFISDYLEQFTDQIYNWWVQLMYVYYDEKHVAIIVGEDKAKEYVELQKDDLVTKLLVSVREGSLIPKDPMIKRNEALELWKSNAIDPIELFKRLDFPNPKETAENLFKWTNTPQALFGGVPAPEEPVVAGNEPIDSAPASDMQNQLQAIASQVQG